MHALTTHEARGFRQFGLRNPIAIIPNGVCLDDFQNLPLRAEAEGIWPALSNRKLLLYLARIHPTKGIAALVEAWIRVFQTVTDWHLVVAGDDEIGMQKVLEQRIADAGASASVSFVGPAYGPAKRQLLGAADAFVLPSQTEGMSVSLLEAQAARLPILATTGCNCPDIEQYSLGLLVDGDAKSLETGLQELLQASETDHRNMGERGYSLVSEKYTWSHIAGQAYQLYQWLNGQMPRPEFVLEGKE